MPSDSAEGPDYEAAIRLALTTGDGAFVYGQERIVAPRVAAAIRPLVEAEVAAVVRARLLPDGVRVEMTRGRMREGDDEAFRTVTVYMDGEVFMTRSVPEPRTS